MTPSCHMPTPPPPPPPSPTCTPPWINGNQQYCHILQRLIPSLRSAARRPEDSLCGSPVAALAEKSGLRWVQGCTPKLPERRRTEKACARRCGTHTQIIAKQEERRAEENACLVRRPVLRVHRRENKSYWLADMFVGPNLNLF